MLSYAFAETSELQQFSHHPLAQVSYRIEARAARGCHMLLQKHLNFSNSRTILLRRCRIGLRQEPRVAGIKKELQRDADA